MVHKFYSDEFKRFAVQLTLSGEKCKSQIARDLGISDSMLYAWIAKFTSGEFTASNRDRERPPIADALQERVRTEHARRLDFIYHQAEEAWIATRGERRRTDMEKLNAALRNEFLEKPLEDEVIAKLMDIVATIFAGHHVGDPRFLEKMLSALADERRMWNANLTENKLLLPPEAKPDEQAKLSDDERIILLRQLFDDAQTRDVASAGADGAGGAAAKSGKLLVLVCLSGLAYPRTRPPVLYELAY
jgi:transposase